MTLGERLSKYCGDNDTNIRAVAEKIDVPEGTLYNISRGRHYSAIIAQKISDGLGKEFECYIKKTICSTCNKSFLAESTRVRDCLDCRVRTRKLVSVKKLEKQSIVSIDEVEAEARKSNISYGQRMAMERLRSTYDKRG